MKAQTRKATEHALDDEIDDLVLQHRVRVVVCDEERYVVALRPQPYIGGCDSEEKLIHAP